MTGRRWLVALVVLGFSGCGGPPVAPVKGRITLDGNPLPHASVSFQPVSTGKNVNPGPGSLGTTDADGNYTLRVAGQNLEGAYVGKHRVEIAAYLKDPDDPQRDRREKVRNLVPARYNTQTTLTFEVLPGRVNEADFALQSR